MKIISAIMWLVLAPLQVQAAENAGQVQVDPIGIAIFLGVLAIAVGFLVWAMIRSTKAPGKEAGHKQVSEAGAEK